MNLRHVLLATAFVVAPYSALAQSSPNFSYGQVPTAAQWNNAFSQKQDVLPFSPLSLAGGSLTGRLSTAPSTVISAKFAMPPGTAPSSPANGDLWATPTGFFGFINNSTIQLADQAVVATKAPIASPTFTGTVSAPVLSLTSSGSSGNISTMSIAPVGGALRTVSNFLADRANVMNFGAVADDATDNTNAVNAAIAAGIASGRPVVFPNTGTGAYRIGSGIVWDGVSVQTDYGVQLKNLDGSQYSGAFASFPPFSVNLSPSVAGKRLDRPGFINQYSNVYQTRTDDHAFEVFQSYIGSAGGTRNPYSNTGANIHVYKDYGRDGASSGTAVLVGGHINMFSGGNGTGFNSTGTFTNGSPTISNVPAAYFTQLTYPAKVTSATAGIPQDTYVVTSNSSAGTVTLSNAFTGTTTANVAFNTVSGRSEITPLSFGANLSNTVKMPGANYYYDFGMSCPTGMTTADRPGYCSGLTSIVQNWAPLGAFDAGHNGVFGGSIATVPGNGAYDSQTRTGQRLYPGDAGLAIVGWSGVVGTATDGRNANATPGWNVGLQIGGMGGSVWMPSTSRSFIGTGVLVQDWSTGIKITGRHPQATGAPLAIDPFQGETLIGTTTTGGGQMSIGNTGAANGTNLVLQEAGVSGSVRAANAYGTGWVMGQDLAGSGSRLFSLLNSGSGTSAFTVDTNNRVGVGTSTPLAALAVTGASQAADTVAAGGNNAIAQFTTGTGAAGDNKLAFGIVDGSYSWLQALQPAVNFRNLVLQPKGGNVGIGTTTPGALLDVAGTVRTPQALLTGYTVATLPTCNAAAKGTLTMATDVSSAPTYRQTGLTGGGTIAVPVFCNGSAYEAH